MNRNSRLLVCVILAVGMAQAQRGIPTGSTELGLALRKLNVLGAALYVAAHPDDENTSVISWLANGRMVRTAYLSMTRGEGGQNLIGPEQGNLLGILRTQELLSARRIDGGEQYFTRAIDFGYSKTSEETIRIWNREKIVGDIVWVIRSFRPDVIVTRFTDSLGTHGNHTSSAILAREAFDAAGDPSRYPEQLRFVKPWQPRRIVFNTFRFGSSGMDPTPAATKVDVGTYSAILGESFTEISGRSRSMHKSQGFGAAENRGPSIQAFEPTAGIAAASDLFDGVNIGWSRIEGAEGVGQLINSAMNSFDPERPAKSIAPLLKAYDALSQLESVDPWVVIKQGELRDVILGCAGFHMEALTRDFSASPGDTVELSVNLLNRSDAKIEWNSLQLPFQGRDTTIAALLANNQPLRVKTSFVIPPAAEFSQPYWLKKMPLQGSYVVDDIELRGKAENPPLGIRITLKVHGTMFHVDVPVRYRWVDRVQGELSRPFVVVPPVSVNFSEDVMVFTGEQEKEIRLMLTATGRAAHGTVKLNVPEGWLVSPLQHEFFLQTKSAEQAVVFRIRPLPKAQGGMFRATLSPGMATSALGLVSLDYPHIDPQVFFAEAMGRLVLIPMKVSTGAIGYVEGSGDDIPAAMKQLGYSVKILTDEDLEFGDLSQYRAIVAGVRAYNTRPKLKAQKERLMEYVRKGGRYVVQYMTREREKTDDIGPFPFQISRDRVTVEEAPVGFMMPDHPILNFPNKITGADFESWVQERGLYFADKWDNRYDTILASHDPGESPQAGGLLVGRYGKGVFIYTGYAFFRQLPAGVPGAYRLFVNLLSN